MPRNQATTARKKSKATAKQGDLSPLFWGISGFILGVVLTGLITTTYHEQHPTNAIVGSRQSKVIQRTPTVPQKPTFDFYTVLPNMDRIIPSIPHQTTHRHAEQQARNSKPKATQSPANHYVLQLASFKHYADADQLKAQLALKGITATIEKVKLHDNEIWYRVKLGPFSVLAQAEQKKDQLARLHINSLLFKINRPT